MTSARYFHGTSARRADAIRARGFRGGETFLTDHEPLAADYADLESPAVLSVQASFAAPLTLDAADGPVNQQLTDLGFPFQATGGFLSQRTIDALTAAGHDALIVRYPADLRDPSCPLPDRVIVRAFDPRTLTVIA